MKAAHLILGLAGVGTLAYLLTRKSVSVEVGSVVKVPVGRLLDGNLQPRFTASELALSMAKDPVGTKAALPDGLATLWDAQITRGLDVQGTLGGVSMSPVEKKGFPALFLASDVAGQGDPNFAKPANLPTPIPVKAP
jgi:hypothetical protein